MTDWDPEALRQRINQYRPFAGAGIEVTYVASDASEVHVQMALTTENVNSVGTHFGGSLYSMVDPHLMLMLIHRIGPRFVVWDKSAHIDFRKPGLGTVSATIRISDAEVEAIREATLSGERHLPEWIIEVRDEGGDVVASVHKTLYVRRRPGS